MAPSSPIPENRRTGNIIIMAGDTLPGTRAIRMEMAVLRTRTPALHIPAAIPVVVILAVVIRVAATVVVEGIRTPLPIS